MMVKELRLTVCIVLIFFISGHSFQRARADYAPEKMRPDNEARQEMMLEPRSFIPHPPPNSRSEVIQPATSANKSKVLTTNQDETNEDHTGSGARGYEDEEEVLKDDEGSSSGSGEEHVSLGLDNKTNFINQDKAIPVASFTAEPIKSYSSHSVPSSFVKNKATDNQSIPPVVNPKENHPENALSDHSNGGKEGEENKEPKNDRVANDVQNKNGRSQGNIGDALKFGLKNGSLKTKGERLPEEDKKVDDDDESGSGIDGEKTMNLEFDGKAERAGKDQDKNAEPGDLDKKNKDDQVDKDDKDDNDDDNDDDDNYNHDIEEDDHDAMSGSGNLPTERTMNKPTLGSTSPASQDSLNKDDNVTAKDDEESEESEDEYSKQGDKMEDAINNDNEGINEEEDEDEEDESQLENKEQEELPTGRKNGLVNVENSTQQKHTNQQTIQQSTVHKISNKNEQNIQNSSKASPPQAAQQQIHQLSTVHKLKSVGKLEKGATKSRNISGHRTPLHSSKLEDSKTLMKKETKKVFKVTHNAANLDKPADVNHHPVKHNDKNPKTPKKIKSLLKYIHQPSTHNREGRHHNKTTPHKCISDDVQTGYSLKGGTRAGHVEDLGGSANMHECIQRCCHKKVCDVALMLDGRCFGVACYSKELCKPIMVPHPQYVSSQIAFMDRAQRRDEVEGAARPEFDCKYGELTIRNNHRWSGELCGGIITCRNGVVTVEKCPGIPSKPTGCGNPKLLVKQRPGQCCIKKWICKDKSCQFGGRRIPHGVSLSDQLCTGVVKCMNGHLMTKECPKIPDKPTNCAHPKLKITTIPGQCCKKRWVCPDKSCAYGKLKVDDGERLTDASCAVVMECKKGFLNFKQCPDPPPVPDACLNPTLKVKRMLGECCHMKWQCAQETK